MKFRLRAVPVMAAAIFLLIGLGACSSSAPAPDSGGSAAGATIPLLTAGEVTSVATDVPYVVLFAGHNYTDLSSKYSLPPFSVYPAFSSWALNLKRIAS